VTSLALPAFVAYAASTLSLQSDILASVHLQTIMICTYICQPGRCSLATCLKSCPPNSPSGSVLGVLVDKALVEATLNSLRSRTSFLAACCQHSGDWLFALTIDSCGLKMDDEAVRVAVGLRLGFDLCVPHECHCGSMVDARGVHSFVCKRPPW